MNKIFAKLSLIGLAALSIFSMASCQSSSKSNQPIVGVIVPMDHVALREITQGIESTLHSSQDANIQIKIKNAYGDSNLQKVIIQQMIQEKFDILVPIGLSAAQMTAHMTHDIPIVSIAAKIDPNEKPLNLTGINDEIELSQQLAFLKAFNPLIKKITLIYSPSEKVFPEVQALADQCQKDCIQLQKLMIHSLNDLYPIAQAIDRDSQLILTLKDHMVVSGASNLAQVAEQLQIPYMASDEGSVQSGAAFALGVKEKEIGKQGAQLILKVLGHTPIAELPLETVNTVHLFINRQICSQQGISLESLQNAAQQCNLNISYLE